MLNTVYFVLNGARKTTIKLDRTGGEHIEKT